MGWDQTIGAQVRREFRDAARTKGAREYSPDPDWVELAPDQTPEVELQFEPETGVRRRRIVGKRAAA